MVWAISFATFWTISSIRAGWIRPSEMSRLRAVLAISLRMGSKQEMTTASGVSSMMMSTPVSVSRVRMLRPSRPMIRPFISSFGRLTVVTVTSEATSVASRWMVVMRMSRALLSALSFASCSMRLIVTWAS